MAGRHRRPASITSRRQIQPHNSIIRLRAKTNGRPFIYGAPKGRRTSPSRLANGGRSSGRSERASDLAIPPAQTGTEAPSASLGFPQNSRGFAGGQLAGRLASACTANPQRSGGFPHSELPPLKLHHFIQPLASDQPLAGQLMSRRCRCAASAAAIGQQ